MCNGCWRPSVIPASSVPWSYRKLSTIDSQLQLNTNRKLAPLILLNLNVAEVPTVCSSLKAVGLSLQMCKFLHDRDVFSSWILIFNIIKWILLMRRPSQSLKSSNHNLLNIPRPRTAFIQRSFAHAAPRVWNSLPHTITDDLNISLHQSLNPDLKHSSTQGPISNHSVTLIAPAIR